MDGFTSYKRGENICPQHYQEIASCLKLTPKTKDKITTARKSENDYCVRRIRDQTGYKYCLNNDYQDLIKGCNP